MIPILEPDRLGAALTTTLFGLKEGGKNIVKGNYVYVITGNKK